MTSDQITFQSLIDHTRHLAAQFPNHYTKQERMMDAIEELGELAQAILIVEKIKTTNDPAKQRTVDDIADALCDILYALINIADDYQLDYPKEYKNMLDRLQKRLSSGEFSRR